ncbi:MAG: DUF4199 domain-containing protein [Lysobacteraceae bacterium]|nr:MAG: DUF4199 domain-containing protein [Xanthomonadaceae bacterium]
MGRNILKYGVIAGLVVGVFMYLSFWSTGGQMPHGAWGMVVGYATMLVALSAVFMGIKHQRDVAGGGVIRFWPAFGMGLAISFIASLFYVATWELVQATLIHDFAGSYADAVIASQKAKGLDGAALAKLSAEMDAFKVQYADPMFRLPMTFTEIFPVGVLVSLVSALVLRNPRVLPAR